MSSRNPRDLRSGDDAHRRASVSGRLRTPSNSNLPRPHTSLRDPRMTASHRVSQPTYNLFTGESQTQPQTVSRPASRHSYAPDTLRPVSRESSKENMAPPDAQEYESHRRCIEELKAELGTLRYSLSTLEQEKDMAEARHRTEVEDQRRRAQEDFEKRTAAEAESAKMARQLESAQEELREVREAAAADKSAAERRVREAESECRVLGEQIDDLATEKDEIARISEKRVMDVQMQLEAAQRAVQELEQESSARESVLQTAQAQVADKDAHIGELEAEVLRLKAHTGDAETMAIIKRELTEQVQHIRKLEATNREQLSELRHLRQIHKAVEVVEEEKRTLQRKLAAAEVVERELAEARIQRQRLEDERRAWTAYLESAAEVGSEDMKFDSPEDLARALVQERLTSASHIEKMGTLQADIATYESTIRALEDDKAQLKAAVENAKTVASTENGDKARARLERQRTLAVKEVEYLRAQLKTFDSEDLTFQPDQYDQVRAQRVQELEDLADKYRAEVQALHAELTSLESTSTLPAPSVKRPRTEEPDGAAHEQLGVLSRKNRTLQDELSSSHTKLALLQKELSVTKEQLTSAKKQSKVRILALRSNPTSDFEAIKMSTLTALRKENEDLLAHMHGPSADHPFPTVPASTLDAAQRQVQEAKAETASALKSARRLKEVWTSKSLEFKEAIFSTLGWTVTFIPNGKMRVESVYCPSVTDEHENSIVFDGEKGTMKVGGAREASSRGG
ncbi:related to spindle assembly checkpoint protein [Cephalotrichum gorgonifer]|uniref:Spindle assembly checkpoint component MAD1 n=1 Tax=Cephalotrichum gorgonifer TaxID=2041049 RepID=A0AAE8MQK8_9PEZI|nr:related to spindle assembly checkpoint protein [Cephalotrichum gorgonifer]